MGKASTRATNKYIAKAYDRVNLTLPRGRKEEIQAHATARAESVNGFISRAISEAMERDNEDVPNAETIAAMKEVNEMIRTGSGQHFQGSTEEFFAMLDAEDDDDA